MNLALRIASTFMRRRNSRWPAFTAIASVVGVAVGVAAFLVVVTVFNSFEKELRQILLAANPHLIVYSYPNGIRNARDLSAQLEKKIDKPLSRVSLFEYSEGLTSFGTRTAAVVLRGIEGTKSANAEDLLPHISPEGALSRLNSGAAGKPTGGEPCLIPAKGLALKLGAKEGDRINLVTANHMGEQQTVKLVVCGTLSLGLSGYDDRLALMSFDEASRLFGRPGYSRGIEFRFKDAADALDVANKLQNETPYILRPWQQIDRHLFEQIERDGTSIKLIVLIITLVAIFNVLTTLTLNVTDRAKQIALLRSIGASRILVLRIFVAMGTILGLFGGVLGIVLGICVLKVFQGFELGELKATYFLERIPVDFDGKLMIEAVVVAVALSFASSLYPAWRATRVAPLQGLRPQHYHF